MTKFQEELKEIFKNGQEEIKLSKERISKETVDFICNKIKKLAKDGETTMLVGLSPDLNDCINIFVIDDYSFSEKRSFFAKDPFATFRQCIRDLGLEVLYENSGFGFDYVMRINWEL